MIPKNFVEESLDRTNIENLIGSYVSLKRAGNNMVGLCPFHSEKSPSFTVFPSDRSFYCFGCGTGGDAITFVRKIENLEYPDAVEFLARRAGLTVPQSEDNRPNVPRFHADRNRVLAMNRDAAHFFHACLLENNPQAKEALAYLTEKRALSMTTVRHFGLGYAPNAMNALSSYLLKKGYTEQELIEGYIAFKSERNGALIDSFRNRVMFPIIDPAGNVIAFGGRVMDDSLPKYKNTSDTPAFKKSKNLFALNFARSCCADRLILCEGYMDVISLHAAGFENAVATLGTAITPEQARMISRYTKQVIISYDMDAAGRKAADKAMKLFEEVGLEVKLLKLEGAKDPDEYIKKNGSEAFRRVLDASDSKFTYNLNRVLSKYDIKDPQQKIEATAGALEMISRFSSAAEREVYLREVSRIFEIDVEALKRDLRRIFAKAEADRKKKESQALFQQTMGYRDEVNTDFAKAPSAARYEETVLGMLFVYPEFRKLCRGDHPLLVPDDFFTAFGKRVFSYVMSLEESPETEEENINEVFSPDEVGRITKMKVNRLLLTDNGKEVFEESVAAMKKAVSAHRTKESGASFDALQKLISEKAGKRPQS